MILNGLTTALRTLTILPAPGKDADKPVSALPWFPLVGALLGLIMCGISRLTYDTGWCRWPEGTAVLIVLAGTVLTGALHLDGLADWADGFFGGRNREDVLVKMRDPHLGSFGTAAVACALLAKWAAISRLVASASVEWIIAAYIVSRAVQVDLAGSQPYARTEGGKAAAFVTGAGTRHVVTAFALALVLIIALFRDRWCGPVTLGIAWLMARAFGSWCRARIGGVTGDTLGAASEIIETAVLFAGAASLPGNGSHF